MILLKIAKQKYNEFESSKVHLVEDSNVNKFLNNLEKYPHAFVLACLMDRGIPAERAWVIPYKVCNILKTKSLRKMASYDLNEYVNIFNTNNLHRYNNKMSEVFYNAIQDIHNKYSDDASNIWNDCPSSAKVVASFLEFKGSGIKISTMAANILARQYRIKFSDYYSIDISPDVHVKKVMKRTGLVEENSSNEIVIYKAREINPKFPGIIDFSCWEIGRKWCHSRNPNCKDCPIESECKKII